MGTKPKKVGAKALLTSQPEKIKVFYEGIQLGQTVKDSAEYAGISESVIYDWQSRGKREMEAGKNTEYTQFVESFNRAKQQFIRNALYQMFQASKKDWRAAAHLLKIRYPKDYGDKQVVAFENKDMFAAIQELSDKIDETE